MAAETAEFRQFCGDYLAALNDQAQCRQPHGRPALWLAPEPDDLALQTENAALAACSEGLLRILAQPAKTRPQLTLEEALRLRANKQLAFHLTATRNVESIMRVGLDPRLGGRGGLCSATALMPGVPSSTTQAFTTGSVGKTFFTTSMSSIDFFNQNFFWKVNIDTTVLAVRFNGNIQSYSVDKSTDEHAYWTTEWIPPEDLLVLTEAEARYSFRDDD